MGLRTAAAAAALILTGCGGDAPDPANQATAEGSAVANGGDPANAAAPAASATAANGGEYVALVGASDLYEIESARLAAEKAASADVRELAAMILADHERSAAELRRAAAAAQPAIAVAPALNAEQQANLDLLRRSSGGVFDQEYLRQQVRAHEQAMTLVTAYAAGGDVEALRRHAAAAAGPIQRHLARARELQAPRPD